MFSSSYIFVGFCVPREVHSEKSLLLTGGGEHEGTHFVEGITNGIFQPQQCRHCCKSGSYKAYRFLVMGKRRVSCFKWRFCSYLLQCTCYKKNDGSLSCLTYFRNSHGYIYEYVHTRGIPHILTKANFVNVANQTFLTPNCF